MQTRQSLPQVKDLSTAYQTHTPTNQQPPRKAEHPTTLIQRTLATPRSLNRANALQLHRTIGNRAVRRLLSGGKTLQPVDTERSQDGRERENTTGLPDHLKTGVETLSGVSLDNVKVHYNSLKPATLQALAYTQGSDIHVAPGQERHLPHEVWHFVQQKQGRVREITQRAGVRINDNRGLEREADRIGNQVENGVGARLTLSANDAGTTSTYASSTQPIQCKNRIDSYTAPQVDDPIDVLHREFQGYYRTRGISEVYRLNQTPLVPASLPAPISAIHPKPKRVITLKATLDGQRQGGPRGADNTQTAYGHLGEYERTIFNRRIASTYAGGHLIADEILGDDSYVQENFAPQHVYFNSPAYRVLEEMAENGPIHATSGNPASANGQTWTMEVALSYDPDYSRTVSELRSVGVIDPNVTQTDSGQATVVFPRRVPHTWKAKLTAPTGYIFAQRQVSGPRQLEMLHGTATQTETKAPLTRTKSNLSLWGMESLVSLGTAPNLTKHVAGSQVENFTGIQTQPEPEATQPTYDPTTFGLPPQPVVKPGVAPQILTQDMEILDIHQNAAVQTAFQLATNLPEKFVFNLVETVNYDLYNYGKITKNKEKLLNAALTRYKRNISDDGISKRSTKKKKQKQKNKLKVNVNSPESVQKIIKALIMDSRLKVTKLM